VFQNQPKISKYQEEILDISELQELTESMCLEEITENEEVASYLPTPLRSHHNGIQALNRHITVLTEGRISPVRFQLNQPISEVAKSTRYYIKRRAKEVINATLNCIAPGQSDELLNLVTSSSFSCDDEQPEAKVMTNLTALYEGSTSWFTKMTVLSIFGKQFTKTQLTNMIPGLTKWRIDQARKHATVVGSGVSAEREPVVRYRLDKEKVEHFLDFISCPNYIQDVAYGTKNLRMSSGEVIEIPNLVRTILSSRMVMLYQTYCKEINFEPLGRSTLFTILKVRIYCTDNCIMSESSD